MHPAIEKQLFNNSLGAEIVFAVDLKLGEFNMLQNLSGRFACSLFAWVLCLSLSSLSSAALAASWSATGPMITARDGPTATLLPSGEVLVAGGAENDNDNPAFTSAERYDPTTEAWSATGSMHAARAWHCATLLPNGKVLVVGGWNDGSSISSVEIYDPATRTWTVTGSLIKRRSDAATATLLLNGKVLVAGGAGGDPPTYTHASAEIYNPATGLWTSTKGPMTSARRGHTSTLLPDGKVLVTGGWIKYTDAKSLASAEIYNPATGLWTPTESMTTARRDHTATLLPNGKVLVAGGWNGDSVVLSSAEIYDPATGKWSITGSMTSTTMAGPATLLPGGKVLVVGGWNGDPLASAEIYDPATGTWAVTKSMTSGRINPTATLLSNGKVLVAGGMYDSDGNSLASAELYTPNGNVVIQSIRVSDLNSNNTPEEATLFYDQTTTNKKVAIRDSVTKTLINTINFGMNKDVPFGLAVVPDINQNGKQEIAVLFHKSATNQALVAIRDSVTGILIKEINFGAFNTLNAKSVTVLEDTDGNGIPEIVVTSFVIATGKYRMDIRDAMSGVLVRNISATELKSPVIQSIRVVDLNSNNTPEEATLFYDQATTNKKVAIRDSVTKTLIKTINFGMNNDVPLGLAVVPDINQNGKQEIAVLFRKSATNQALVAIRDPMTGTLIKEINFGAFNTLNAKSVTVLEDTDGNGMPEIAVTSFVTATGKYRMDIRDAMSGVLVRSISVP
jgi:N-acetylneuraminic acid mutarotase